ncbi:MAG: hypothetical protein ACKPKO_38100 [Candidatus Fonsibacter sp.]
MAKFDGSGYDAIVFDEILFCSVRHLAKTKRYCDNNPDNIVIATGARINWSASTAPRTKSTTMSTTTCA